MQGRTLLLMIFLGCSAMGNAEVYRWVDKDGKVHFTDKPPAANAEDITKQVSKQNLDTSREELNKVQQLHIQETEAQQQRNAQQAMSAGEAYALATRCAAAKNRLRRISGNVIFIDDQGKVVKTTEKERQAMVAELTTYIDNHCP
ncbi:hypothetical protein CBP51_09320 [Cellvibrio mixtus]|uniref:DUF4124 domain-containing protein n=1 Tax=Cellvibrio mixtus TaxID=39650 RepID=A0A266QC03_9GAMM|nr:MULTISPECIES: DUF4124 domain-containing protein [Cellvibrio]AQT60846.1 hypothetical protein B0D95_12715 [Cellvibrio sp. PSBB023]OZY87166.1 hypothetical protein CBP51_09320 [Cellvibrio mixtus]